MKTARRVLLRTRDGFTEKRCTSCLRWLPVAGTARGFDLDPRRVCGVRNDCKQCRAGNRAPRARNYAAEYSARKQVVEHWKDRALRAERELRKALGA
jgi:hypothetical protein